MKFKTIRNTVFILLAIALVVAVVLYFSKTKIKVAPPAATTLDTTLTVPLSQLIFPVDFEVRELNSLLNTAISGKFFQASLNINERGDILDLEITKSSPIKINWQMPFLEMEVPLHLSGIGKVKVGKRNFSNKEAVEGDLILKLRSEIAISSDWKLKTKSAIKDITWVNDPYIKIAFLKLNLRKKVDAAIKAREAELLKNFDTQIGEKIELKKAITKIWMDIQKPVRINKKEVLVWLRSRCESISAVMVDKGPASICVQVACYTQTQVMFDNDTAAVVNATLPPYTKSEKGLKDGVELYIGTAIPFALANEKLNEKIKGFKIIHDQYSVRVKDVEMYGTDSVIVVKVNLRGDIKGDIYLTGRINYDSVSNTIGLNQIKYDVNTQNKLLQTADWIFHNDLPRLIGDKLKISMDSLTGRLPLLMDKGIEESKVGKKLDANISIDNIRLQTIVITKNNIQLIALAHAKAGISIDKRAFTKNLKPIRITKVKQK